MEIATSRTSPAASDKRRAISKYATETIEIRKMIYVYRKKMLGGDNDVGQAEG